MFGKRLVSGILLVAIALVTIISGGYILFFTTLFISIVGMLELYKVMNIQKSPMGIWGYLAAIAYYSLIYWKKEEHLLMIFIILLMLLMATYVFLFPKYTSEQVTCAFFGLFYVGIMLSFIYRVRVAQDGAVLVGLIFLSSWGSDTCAYCVGMLLGKHKLAPVLSPKKSIEGAVGGMVGATVLGMLYGLILKGYFTNFENPVFVCGLLCAIGSMLSQIGDLAASAIRRNHDVKDFGTLIPGHGGILDRFDSMIFTAPVIYFVAMYLK